MSDILGEELRIGVEDEKSTILITAGLLYISFIRYSRSPNDPFFVTSASPSSSSHSLTPDCFIKWFKHRSVQVGLDPKHMSGHSLRRGGTTAMFIAGCSESVIAQHGRWRSLTYRQYFDATIPHYLATSTLLHNSNIRFLSDTASSVPPLLIK